MATMEPKTKACNQDDATGFIRHNGYVTQNGIVAKVHGKI